MYRWIVLVVLSVHSDRTCYSWCWFVLPERYKYWVNKLIDSVKSYDTRTRVGVLIQTYYVPLPTLFKELFIDQSKTKWCTKKCQYFGVVTPSKGRCRASFHLPACVFFFTLHSHFNPILEFPTHQSSPRSYSGETFRQSCLWLHQSSREMTQSTKMVDYIWLTEWQNYFKIHAKFSGVSVEMFVWIFWVMCDLCYFFLLWPAGSDPRSWLSQNSFFWKLVFPWLDLPLLYPMENCLWEDVVFKLRKTRQKLALSWTPLGAVRAAAQGAGYKNRRLGKSDRVRYDSRLV